MRESPCIYFHVGLGKTGSTWLQQRVFPKLDGVRYIPPRDYRRVSKLISRLKGSKMLVSRELDRQFDREVKWFISRFPETRVIIVFRRHDTWLASQYRRHVKNGWAGSVEKFLDLTADTGQWKQSDLLFYPKLRFLDQHCRHKPLVLFYEDLLERPRRFIQRIAAYTGTTVSRQVDLRRSHPSFSDKQLLVLRHVCRKFLKRPPRGHSNRLMHWLLYRPVWALFHFILYIARILPDRLVPEGPLMEPKYLEQIKDFYKKDWEQVVAYVAENEPSEG